VVVALMELSHVQEQSPGTYLEDVGTSDLIGSEWYVPNTNFYQLLLKTYLLRAQNAIKKLYKLSAGRLKADLAVHVTSIKGLFSRLRIHLTPPDRGPHRTWGGNANVD
jgi:hypothetical protein